MDRYNFRKQEIFRVADALRSSVVIVWFKGHFLGRVLNDSPSHHVSNCYHGDRRRVTLRGYGVKLDVVAATVYNRYI